MANLKIPDIKGILPAVTPRKLSDPHLVYARNVNFSLNGPQAGFGSVLGSISKIYDSSLHTKTFDVDGVKHIFTAKAVLRHDNVTNTFYPAYVFPSEYAATSPWFGAKVGADWFFVKSGISGYIHFDVSADAWAVISPSGMPANPVSLTRAYGRLIIVGDTYSTWSALDDGTDLTPSLTTGAGSQSHAIVGGTPYAVAATEDGFFTFTSEGIMTSRNTAGPAVFTHDVKTGKHTILNGFCIAQLTNSRSVFLDRNGFWSTSNSVKVAEEWEPLMGQYFQDTIIPSTDITTYPDAIKLEYSERRRELFVSVRELGAPYYSRAYVQTEFKKWGSFDQLHKSFGEFGFSSEGDGFSDWGFIDNDGDAHYLNRPLYIEARPEDETAFLYLQDYEFPVRNEGSTPAHVFPARFAISNIDRTPFEATAQSGYYVWEASSATEVEPNIDAVPQDVTFSDVTSIDYDTDSGDEDWDTDVGEEDWDGKPDITFRSGFAFGAAIQPEVRALVEHTKAPLDAEMVVGLFRFEEQERPDETSQVQHIAVGMPEGAETTETDYDTALGGEDWDTASGSEDWDSGGTIAQFSFTITHQVANDGVNVDQTETPSLAHDENERKYYSLGSNNGVYHRISLTANENGEYFHLQSLEVAGILTGVL